MDAQEAIKKFEEAKSYWSDIYESHKSDVRFSIGLDHWSDADLRNDGKATLIVPVLPQYIHQVVNDMRMNTPSINVLPGEGEGDVETAEVFKGLIRNIEYKSKADSVYDTAGEYAVRGGLGFIAIDHDYVDEESFLQELKLRRIQNPESVYLDPTSIELDGSDAEIGFILDTMTKADFEKKYPGKSFVSFDSEKTANDVDTIRLCEVFVKEYETIKKQLDVEGNVIDFIDDGDEKKKTRTLRKVKIRRYKFSGQDLLEETTFPGKYIPIVPVFGEEVWVDSKRHVLSLITLAKDAQRRLNKWASKESEILDMAPVAPFIAPAGAVDNFMDEWGSPGDYNVLRYNPQDSEGNQLDRPSREAPPPIPTGIINAMVGAKESVKEALGMYSASIGQKSNAISGVAYNAQKVEGEVATFHFQDNRNKSIEQVGRILVSAIPEVYDTARIIQIIGKEEEPQLIGINGAIVQDQKRGFDLTKGKYDVRIATGVSYTTKRQETAALMGDLLKASPQLLGVFGDLYFKNLDVAGAEAIAERVKKTIPKELIADENKENPQDPEKMQMAQVIEQLQGKLQELMAEVQSKQAEQQVKMAELAIKQEETLIKKEEVNIKKEELGIKGAETKLKYLQAFNQEKETEIQAYPEDDIPTLQNKLQSKMMSEEKAAQEQFAKQEQERMEKELEAQKEAEERAIELAKLEQSQQAAQAVIMALGSISEQLNGLTAQVSKPMTVIRDENGAIIGAN